MAIVRWDKRGDIFEDIRNMQHEMERLWRSLYSAPGSWTTPNAAWDWGTAIYPPVNAFSKDDRYIVECELPGFNKDSIDLTVSGNTLVIKGEFKEESAKNVSYHRRERRSGQFSRSIQLPDRIDPEKTTASFNNGILTVELSKAEEVKPRQITVKAG
jgi:HSP20 family protein